MPLWKDDSGKARQRIEPNRWTWVEIAGVKRFWVEEHGRWLWEFILQVELPEDGRIRRVRTRLVRYPNTQKADATAHQTWNAYGLGGGQEHILCAHSIVCDKSMPIGLWLWHDGVKPLALDGRQLKASKMP